MWQIISPFLLSGLFYCLVMQVVQCFTEGRTGGIPEDETEDEKNN